MKRESAGQHLSGSLALALTVGLALLFASGCGSGSGDGGHPYSVEADTTVTTAAIPVAGYVPRINRICRGSWGIILGNFAKYSGGQDPKLPPRKRFAEAVRLSLTAGIVFYIFDGIYNLGAPRGEEREVEKIIGTMQSASERAQKSLAPVFDVAQVAALYSDYNRLARRYGLDECLVDRARLRPLEAH